MHAKGHIQNNPTRSASHYVRSIVLAQASGGSSTKGTGVQDESQDEVDNSSGDERSWYHGEEILIVLCC